MTHVFEVLRLEPFREFELQAGESGLQNEVTNVTILDYETDARDYSGFRPGDFILSSLYFAKNDESLILEAFRALITKGISGFAIKTVYYFTISEKLRRMADAAGVPIFAFHTTSMEDIIIAVSELMKEKDRQAADALLLRQLLHPALDEGELGALVHRLDEHMKPWCAAAYATFRENVPTPLLPSRQTTRWVPMDENGLHYSMFIYQGGVLLLVSCQEEPEESFCRPLLLAKLEALRMPLQSCRVGFSQTVQTRKQLDACISQSLQANRLCRLWNYDFLCYSRLGIYRFLMPLLEAPGCRDECLRQIEALRRYDEEHAAALLETLTAYVRCQGDIKQAAGELFQHPNTVRYRLKKVRQVLGDPPDFELQAVLCVQLYHLSEELRSHGC